ncbi:MAG: response regulator transcription factor [Phycisphaerales bacterium]|nr:response regulator transcription factor [Phycisphaerales bacterium]
MAQLPAHGQAIVEAVATNPFMGIAVMCATGRFIYLNDWVARAMRGPSATAREIVGRSLHDEFQATWADERLQAVRHVMLTGRPLLVRILWEGLQYMTWFRALTPPDAAPGQGAVIAMAHRVMGDAREFLTPEMKGYLESSTVRLGPLNKLSTPELRVLALLGRGLSVREVAKELFRAEKTVEFHRTSIHRKLSISDRVELAGFAQRAGLTLEDADRPRV